MKFYLLLLVIIGINFNLNSQTSEELLFKILDKESNLPISYATIRFAETQRGVIANEEGDFRLPIEFKTENRVVIISSIGFETLTLNIGNYEINNINKIYLKVKAEELETIVISGSKRKVTNKIPSNLTASQIVKNAIGRIPTNYPYQPHSSIAYYRDYQIVKSNYYNLNEGILEVFDAGFNTNKYLNKYNRTALYSFNLNTKYLQDTLLLRSIYGKSKNIASDNSLKLGTNIQNELEILNIHNPIRNFKTSSFSFIYVLRNDFIKNHNFKISGIKYIENEPLYEIRVYTKENLNRRYYGAGKLYISKTNFAIHRLEYGVYDSGMSAARRGSFGITRSNASSRNKEVIFEITVEYKSVGSKMFLNYMTFNNRFVINEPKPFKLSEMTFNAKNENFVLTFNKPVDKTTIGKKSNFKLYYKGKKLIIKNIDLIKDNKIAIEVLSWSAGERVNTDDITKDDFSFKLKRIKDVFGGVIDKKSQLVGYQYRELFTQEIFENKNPPEGLIFVDKLSALSFSRINKPEFNISDYWVNSPLMEGNVKN